MINALPEWNGKVVGVMHRMYMTQIALAKEMGVSRQYVNGILASKYHTQAQRTKVVTALESFARSRGLKLSDLWCPEPHA